MKKVGEYQTKLRGGLISFPVPSNDKFPSFYLKAQDISKRLVVDMARGSGWMTSNDGLLTQRIFQVLQFSERLQEGDRLRGQDFATFFGEKLTTWSYLVQSELAKLEPNDWDGRDLLIKGMVREVLLYSLSDALKVYISALATPRLKDAGENPINALWDSGYSLEWESYLQSEDFSNFFDVTEKGASGTIVDQIVQNILPRATFQELDIDAVNESLALSRAREVLPLAKEAAIANEAFRFMKAHEDRQGIAYAALPGTGGISSWVNPWSSLNYYYEEAQIKDVTHAPACFQVPDGFGHEGMYADFRLDPTQKYNPVTGLEDPVHSGDYLAVREGLKSMISNKVEDLSKTSSPKGLPMKR